MRWGNGLAFALDVEFVPARAGVGIRSLLALMSGREHLRVRRPDMVFRLLGRAGGGVDMHHARKAQTLLIPWWAVAIRPRLHAEVAASKKDLPHVSERDSRYPLRRRTTGCSGCLTALASTKQRPCAGLCFFGLCSQREHASLVPSTLELLDVFARRATEILAYCSNYRTSQLAARDFVDGTASLHLLHHR
jgi:hypothetical protein